MGFPVAIITDCKDDNAKMRQISRMAALMPEAGSIAFCGVNSTLEAAGNIVDALDAFNGRPGLILANVALRSGEESRLWENGSPFGYLWAKKSLVVGTVDGYTFSALQKVIDRNIRLKVINIADIYGKRIANSQFRSFEFMPRVAADILREIRIPTHHLIKQVPVLPAAVWWVDNFGNLKTTLLPGEVRFRPGRKLSVKVDIWSREITCYEKLAVVPDGELGLIIGSSGYSSRRFLEIVLQGGSASRKLGLLSGDKIVFV